MGKRLYVGNLSFNATELDLRTNFSISAVPTTREYVFGIIPAASATAPSCQPCSSHSD